MAVARCSECKERLVFPEGHAKAGQPRPAGTKTCSPAHRQTRARRLARAAKANVGKSRYSPEHQEMAEAVRGRMKDAVHEAAVDELRPLVREAMTEDVLRGIDMMIKATPDAIDLLKLQMASEDETIAQRAATLLLKYTLGNPSVAPPPTQQAAAPLSVVFNVPRPGDTIAAVEQHSDTETLRECADCNAHKPEGDFVGASDRCLECFEALQDTVTQRFAE